MKLYMMRHNCTVCEFDKVASLHTDAPKKAVLKMLNNRFKDDPDSKNHTKLKHKVERIATMYGEGTPL